MKKQIFSFALGATLVGSTLLGGVATHAAEKDDMQLTKDYQINWDSAWENASDASKSVDFGSASSNGISLYAWGDLATGKTSVTGDSTTATSKGTTKGKVLTTVTSATTSIKDVEDNREVDGKKGTAIGTLTSSSEASIKKSKHIIFNGLTIHTATDSGVLYQANTTDLQILN